MLVVVAVVANRGVGHVEEEEEEGEEEEVAKAPCLIPLFIGSYRGLCIFDSFFVKDYSLLIKTGRLANPPPCHAMRKQTTGHGWLAWIYNNLMNGRRLGVITRTQLTLC